MQQPRAKDILERMRTVAAGPAAPAEATRPAPFPKVSGGERRIRYTIDLDRRLHRVLKLYALDAGVNASEVIRALLGLLEQDPALGQRVQELLER